MAFLNRTFAAATIAAAGLASPPMSAPAWAQTAQPATVVSAANDTDKPSLTAEQQRTLDAMRGTSGGERPFTERLARRTRVPANSNGAPAVTSVSNETAATEHRPSISFNNAAPAARSAEQRNADMIACADYGSLSIASLVSADTAKGFYHLRTAATPSAAELQGEVARYGTHAIVILNGVNRAAGGPSGFTDENNQIQSDLIAALGPRWADKSDAPVILIEYQSTSPAAEIFTGTKSVGTVSYPQALAAVPAHVTGDARWKTAMRNMNDSVNGWVANANTHFAATPEPFRVSYAMAKPPEMTPEQRAAAELDADNLSIGKPGTDSLGYLVSADPENGFYHIRLARDPQKEDGRGVRYPDGRLMTAVDREASRYEGSIIIKNFVFDGESSIFDTYSSAVQNQFFLRMGPLLAANSDLPIVYLEVVGAKESEKAPHLWDVVYGNSLIYAVRENRLGLNGEKIDIPENHLAEMQFPFANISFHENVLGSLAYNLIRNIQPETMTAAESHNAAMRDMADRMSRYVSDANRLAAAPSNNASTTSTALAKGNDGRPSINLP